MSRTTPKVLVLLATFNGGKFVADQIASVLAQRDVDASIFVRDDGSVDETKKILEDLESKFPDKIVIIRNSEFSAPGAAKNFFNLIIAGSDADCDFVAFCDQDDVWLPNKLIEAVLALQQNGADCYSSSSTLMWDYKKFRFNKKETRRVEFDYFFESASHGCTFVFSRNVLGQFAKFLTSNAYALKDIKFHDWLLYFWAKSSHLKWFYDERSFILYRQGVNNVIGANSGFGALIKRVKLLNKGFIRLELLRYLELFPEQRGSEIGARVFRWNRIDRIFLAINALKFRSRRTHAIGLALCILTIGM
ncbi:MAG: glycosyltransferase [Pseudacidovorax sp.]|uniref:glycosyltransferase n=1 Tax=Pseudacidovorax sp. TaxID=1934311 RepID=UPI001B6E8844|nr:glycosyltransferase [Pseudacidovorax sp.]MBP6896394.1 glycosyltransferase [Pseudacidovorax sp.]